jgi:glycosyltransferase involved in cell wall biosynthesis
MTAPIVAIDCRYIGPRPSGIGEVVQALVDHAPVLAPDLRFLFLKQPGAPARLSEASNVEEVVVRAPANGPTTMWLLPQAVDLSRISLFHATFNIMPAGLKMPCVTTVHDIMWLAHPELCRPRFWRGGEAWFYRQGIRRALDKAAAIATVSEASRTAVAEFAPATATRVHVTRSGVSPDFRPRPASDAALTRMGLSPGRRYVLTVGQYAPYKNHEGALAGFAAAFADRQDIDLVLVQRLDQAADRLRRQAKALGIADRVHFLSGLTRDQLVTLYGGAGALLHPSFYEGFGNPLAEAMACGCPVVASDRSAMPEVTGGAALLADPTDHAAIGARLREVIEDGELAARLSASGIARAAELSWLGFAEDNVALYRRLLASDAQPLRAATKRPRRRAA